MERRRPTESASSENVARDDHDEASESSRRGFLVQANAVTLGVLSLGVVAGGLRAAFPNVNEGAAQRFVVGRTFEFEVGSLTCFEREGVFLLRREMGFAAISTECTHLGCPVRHTAEGFTCPCHGARYDPFGRVLSGPARRPLTWYRIQIDGEARVWVDCDSAVDVGSFTSV